MKRFAGLFCFLLPVVALAKDPYIKNAAIDVTHYEFHLEVNDSTDILSGSATVNILFLSDVSSFDLDLTDATNGKNGMQVTQVTSAGSALKFSHTSDRLKIFLPATAHRYNRISVRVDYHGVPRDGLIIGKNKYGDRGFFGDNWPDRGHHWLPVIDHPSDKASVDFIVIAPLQYSVVANGVRMEESLIDVRRKLTRWHEETPLPVKVMVVGIARFAVQYAGSVDAIPVESWVYPQNREAGFTDYAVAVKILDYFHRHVGDYPFRKLANVQSKTRWGGLENANAIFYAESSVTGLQQDESLIAHEEAHQWFGNCVTENDWHHVWLSEGFSTYFCNLYLEYAYGHDRLVEEERKDRDQVIAYYRKNPGPVVDTTITDIGTVLNTNTYQKAGWVLHMLRHRIGDDAFWRGIRQYYATFRYQNALTDDFRAVMEQASGTDLSSFFTQWLRSGGHPKLSGSWSYDPRAGTVTVSIEQVQKENPFSMPLELGLRHTDGKMEVVTVQFDKRAQKFSFATTEKPVDIIPDPHTWLLFEGNIRPK